MNDEQRDRLREVAAWYQVCAEWQRDMEARCLSDYGKQMHMREAAKHEQAAAKLLTEVAGEQRNIERT